MEPVFPNRKEVLDALVPLRRAAKRIVFTNGCFDILHVGHVRYLAEAKSLGNVLVVGLNSDSSVRRLKGEQRPIVPEAERCEMLLALSSVNFVCVFEEDTPLELIKEIRPDILVKGGDWEVEKIVGHEFVASYGGETRSLPFVEGASTTNIIDKVLKIHGEVDG